ncbi:MAG: WbqC family protein [Bacteroidota bacterium]
MLNLNRFKMMDEVILSTAWLGPIEYFAWIAQSEKAMVEHSESYVRQTYRNRCVIATANGKQELSVAIVKSRKNHVPIREAIISYDNCWNVLHWRTIESAYNNSPFFLYYRDALEPFFTRPFRYLTDLNAELLATVLAILKIKTQLEYTNVYLKEYAGIPDLRYTIIPEKTATRIPSVAMPGYTQVFEEKIGFIPNLSILDLIFNKGPEANDYLLKCTLSK